MKKIIILTILAVLFIGTFVFLWGKSQPEVIEYEEVHPSIGTISKSTIVTGKIEPRNEVNVKPQISGIITEILKEPASGRNGWNGCFSVFIPQRYAFCR